MQEVSTRYILDSQKHPIAVQIPFEQFQKMVEILEASGQFIFTQENLDESLDEALLDSEDVAWMQMDVSNLGTYDTYDWQPGELGEGDPLKYTPGIGWVIQE